MCTWTMNHKGFHVSGFNLITYFEFEWCMSGLDPRMDTPKKCVQKRLYLPFENENYIYMSSKITRVAAMTSIWICQP